MAATTILDYRIREILMADAVWRSRPITIPNSKNWSHQHAKIRQNRSIGCKDIKIFRFFQMAAAAILDFQICEILLADGVWWAYTHNCAKIRLNRSLRCGDIAIFKIAATAISFLKL